MRDDSRHYHRQRGVPRNVRFQNAGGTNVISKSPFGTLPTWIGKQQQSSYYGPLAKYFGFGAQAGTPQATKQAGQLANATGPLADVIRQFSAFEPGAFPEAQKIGAEVSARGSAAYTTLQSQIDSALKSLPGYQQQAQMAAGMAQQAAQQAFSPVANEDLYRTAADRLQQGIGTTAAAQGMENSGGAQQAQTDALRQLTLGFRDRQAGEQSTALQNFGAATNAGANLSAAGIPIADQGMQAVSQLGQLLSAKFGIPEAQAGQLLQLLMGGAPGQSQLLGQTAPVVATQQPSKFGLLNWIL